MDSSNLASLDPLQRRREALGIYQGLLAMRTQSEVGPSPVQLKHALFLFTSDTNVVALLHYNLVANRLLFVQSQRSHEARSNTWTGRHRRRMYPPGLVSGTKIRGKYGVPHRDQGGAI